MSDSVGYSDSERNSIRLRMDRSSSRAKGSFSCGDDVLTDILLRLPTKSLVRFKLVCKSWLSIISSHHFCKLHTQQHHKLQPSFILRQGAMAESFYFHPLHSQNLTPYHFTLPNPKIVSSSHGLLLLKSDSHYFVYNPTTKKSRHITLEEQIQLDLRVMGLTLAFDPAKSPYYKIICARIAKTPLFLCKQSCQIDIYSSQMHTWKLSIKKFLATPQKLGFISGVYLNNQVYWPGSRTFMYFDINRNVVGDFPCPDVPRPPRRGIDSAQHDHQQEVKGRMFSSQRYKLQEVNGSLYDFTSRSDYYSGDTSMVVLELKDDYSQWVMRYNEGFGALHGRVWILCLTGGEKRETDTLVYYVPGKIIVYKFIDKSSKEVDVSNGAFNGRDSLQFGPGSAVHVFGETLAPV